MNTTEATIITDMAKKAAVDAFAAIKRNADMLDDPTHRAAVTVVALGALQAVAETMTNTGVEPIDKLYAHVMSTFRKNGAFASVVVTGKAA